MKNLPEYLSLLKRLPLSSQGEAVLASAGECKSKKDLCRQLGEHLGGSIDSLTLDLAREIDESSRQLALERLPRHGAQPDFADDNLPECRWLWAKIVEYVLSTDARPFCAFCYRTVAVRSNGRPKDYCPEHASGSQGNAAGYLRGRAHQKAFADHLAAQESPDELAFKLLRFQFYSRRNGGGNPGDIVKHSIDNIRSSGIQLDAEEGGLDWMTRGQPDWTELALRWRKHVQDDEGVVPISNGSIAVTPLRLVEQWIRWNAWKDRGDFSARVGKGRPAKFDHDEAVRLRDLGMPVSEIAKRFPEINPKSLFVFFSRRDLAQIDREEALQMHADGKTDEQIAARFEVSARSVAKVLSQQGEVDSGE